jgi:hypothetical protein
MSNAYTSQLNDACAALARAMQASKPEPKKDKIYNKGKTLLIVRRGN